MQIIAIWIGLFITFVLGVVNFLWGPAILARREKVIVREPELTVSIVEKPQQKTPHLTEIERIFIQCRFKLVRTRGTQDLHLESAYLQLNKGLRKELEPYFRVRNEGRIYWEHRSYISTNEAEYKTLEINKPREFNVSENFNTRSSLGVLEKEIQSAQTKEEIKEKQASLKNLKDKVKKLKAKYMIVWIDGRGTTRRYKIPEKCWNKFLPEHLWWKVA